MSKTSFVHDCIAGTSLCDIFYPPLATVSWNVYIRFTVIVVALCILYLLLIGMIPIVSYSVLNVTIIALFLFIILVDNI